MVTAYASVAAFLDSLDAPRREVVDLLRQIIVRGRPDLVEQIKWNAPSYALHGVDRLTLNVSPKRPGVRLVLHLGTQRREDKAQSPVLVEDEGLVAWQSDIRGVLSFADREDLAREEPAVSRIVTRWLDLG